MNVPFILWTACFLESITYILRFGFDFHSKSIQKKIHLPWRIHHMYIGILITLLGLIYNIPLFPDLILGATAITLLDIGVAITLSDIIHHFIILPIFQKKIDFP